MIVFFFFEFVECLFIFKCLSCCFVFVRNLKVVQNQDDFEQKLLRNSFFFSSKVEFILLSLYVFIREININDVVSHIDINVETWDKIVVEIIKITFRISFQFSNFKNDVINRNIWCFKIIKILFHYELWIHDIRIINHNYVEKKRVWVIEVLDNNVFDCESEVCIENCFELKFALKNWFRETFFFFFIFVVWIKSEIFM